MIKEVTTYLVYDLSIKDLDERREKVIECKSAIELYRTIGLGRTHVYRYITRGSDGRYPRYRNRETGKMYAIRVKFCHDK